MAKIHDLLIAFLFAMVVPSVKASPAPLPTSWHPEETTPALDAISAAAKKVRDQHCRSETCKALLVVYDMLVIDNYASEDAMGAAKMWHPDEPARAGRRFDRLLLNHPGLFEPVCDEAARLMAQVHVTPTTDWFVPTSLLANSVDMDQRSHGTCTQTLVAALPREPENDRIRFSAWVLCGGDYLNHHPSPAACSAIIQGIEAERLKHLKDHN